MRKQIHIANYVVAGAPPHKFAFPIDLVQHGRDKFAVVYGRQIDAQLNYAQAAAKLGEAILHALSCDGVIDNRMKRER